MKKGLMPAPRKISKRFVSIGVVSLVCIIVSCSTTPDAPLKSELAPPPPPAWTRQPARALVGDELVYIGIGEDRKKENAKTKAEAYALQNLANDCSFIPKDARIQDKSFEESSGIITRIYAQASVSSTSCEKAKSATDPAQIVAMANPEFVARVSDYQTLYDPPEPEEAMPLRGATSGPSIMDVHRLVIVRQQVALTKQDIILYEQSPDNPPQMDGVTAASRAVSGYEQGNSQVWSGISSLSNSRPNWVEHQPDALRETIAERLRIKNEYPNTTPLMSPKKGGTPKGRRRRFGQPNGTPAGTYPESL